MKIAVDIDDVLFEFAKGYFKFAGDNGHLKINFDDILIYEFWDLLGITKDEAYGLANRFLNSYELGDELYVDGAKEFLGNLKEHELVFITHRPKRFFDRTVEFLNEGMGLTNPEVMFAGGYDANEGSRTKDEICKDLGVSFIIEDNGMHSIEYARNGVRVLLLNKPWNVDYHHENLIRCHGWDDVLNKIGGVENE